MRDMRQSGIWNRASGRARHARLGHACLTSAAALLLGATLSSRALAQGAGTAGQQALQLPAGARAAALGGAYAGAADADVLFYNPAGSGALVAGAALSFQRHVQDVTFGTLAVAHAVGPVVLGLGVAYLDAGSVDVIEPDPAYGGERGRSTGTTATAGESATRLTIALPVGERLRVGMAAGLATSSIAGLARSAPFGDVGAQLVLPRITVGASLRNLGRDLKGSGTDAGTPLPREARLGATLELPGMGPRLGGRVAADWVQDLVGRSGWLVGGVEAGLVPGAARPVGVVGRLGWNAGGDALQGALTVGGGVQLKALALDYAWQRLEAFGSVHRVGVRWVR